MITEDQKNRFESLRDEAVKKFNEYLAIDSELTSHDGFHDIQLVGKLKQKYEEWQVAGNNFHAFLITLKAS